ncbi:MAG: LuxR C-terminal-related transcriptional regulator, partial [Coriobacteriales bacterium]|nr:LuxR C-terminal-related transcriptional regulator [Coriobacteriales bacterium]
IDDCHLLEDSGSSHRALGYLIAHLPTNLQLVILSRKTPNLGLLRWHLEDRLVLIGEQELSFTSDELAEFFRKVGLVLSDSSIAKLQMYTKGWPAAIKLFSLQFQSTQAFEAFFEREREVPDSIAAYLHDEVFMALDARTQWFLLNTAQTALFCVPMAAEITGMSSTAIGQMLDALLTERVFIEEIPKAGAEPWYQYHPIFSKSLLSWARHNGSVDSSRIFKLASIWFEDNGNVNQAVCCAQNTQDYSRIGQLMLRHWRVMFMEDNTFMLYRWGCIFPTEKLLADPRLCCIVSYAAILANDKPLSQLCERVAATHFTDPSAEFYAEAMAIMALLFTLEERYGEAREAAETALRLIPESDYFLCSNLRHIKVVSSKAPDWRENVAILEQDLNQVAPYANTIWLCNRYAIIGASKAMLGDFSNALDCLKKGLALPLRATYPYRVAYMNIYLAQMIVDYHHGSLHDAKMNERRHSTILKGSFSGYLLSLSLAYRALFAYLDGSMPEMERATQESISVSPYGFLTIMWPLGLLRRIESESQVDLGGFLQMTSKDYGHTLMWQRLHFVKAYLDNSLGMSGTDGETLEGLRGFVADINVDYRLERLYGFLLLAVHEELCGNVELAQEALSYSLELAAPEEIDQLYCNDWDLVLPILSRWSGFGSDDPFARKLFVRLSQIANGEIALVKKDEHRQLTPRESDVAYLLVAGYTVGAIAQRLGISAGTVRKHMANIYGKLGVHSRTQLVLHMK